MRPHRPGAYWVLTRLQPFWAVTAATNFLRRNHQIDPYYTQVIKESAMKLLPLAFIFVGGILSVAAVATSQRLHTDVVYPLIAEQAVTLQTPT